MEPIKFQFLRSPIFIPKNTAVYPSYLNYDFSTEKSIKLEKFFSDITKFLLKSPISTFVRITQCDWVGELAVVFNTYTSISYIPFKDKSSGARGFYTFTENVFYHQPNLRPNFYSPSILYSISF